MLETDFITQLIDPGPSGSHESAMEVLADGCTNVFVWHQDGKSEPKGRGLREIDMLSALTYCCFQASRFISSISAELES